MKVLFRTKHSVLTTGSKKDMLIASFVYPIIIVAIIYLLKK